MTWVAACHRALFSPAGAKREAPWLAATLALAAAYGWAAIAQFPADGVAIPDDGRQHLFWMARFENPALFPGDRIADYFQSVAPWGFAGLYRGAAALGIDSGTLARWLPLPLSLATGFFGFRLAIALFPVPAAALAASVLLLQNLWLRDDLASGTARALLNPLFLAVLWLWTRRWDADGTGGEPGEAAAAKLHPGAIAGFLAAIALLSGFYPHYVLTTGALLGLQVILRWRRFANARLGRLGRGESRRSGRQGGDWRAFLHRSSRDRELRFCLLGLAATAIALLPFVLAPSEFGPVLTAAQARELPEFLPDGRTRFFYEDFGRFWLSGGRSGLQVPLDPPLLALALTLPGLWRFRDRFPLLDRARPAIALLPLLTGASLLTFAAAHALLFRLHLPSRYTQHALRIVFALAAAIALAALLERLLVWAGGGDRGGVLLRRRCANGTANAGGDSPSETLSPAETLRERERAGLSGRSRSPSEPGRPLAAAIALLAAAGLLAFYPLAWDDFPKANLVRGAVPELYAFFRSQPIATQIVGTGGETNNLPAFARRSVLTGSEFAIPYHWGYYGPFRSRVQETIRAQYSPDPAVLRSFEDRYGADFWVLDRGTFSDAYLAENDWLRQYDPAYGEARAILQRGEVPALARRRDRCTVLETDRAIVLAARCDVEAVPAIAQRLRRRIANPVEPLD